MASEAPPAPPDDEETEKKILHTYPLVMHSDMEEEMCGEIVELSTSACEKFAANYELAARTIKETLDKKYGIYWHVVVGEAFGFEVTYETKNILYVFFAGTIGIAMWKC